MSAGEIPRSTTPREDRTELWCETDKFTHHLCGKVYVPTLLVAFITLNTVKRALITS